MGLRKADMLLPVAALSGVIVLAGIAGTAGREWLAYSRSDIAAGELWRLVSGHLVHLSWSHLILNVLGLWLVSLLVARAFSAHQWLLVTAVVITGLDIGLWLLEPDLHWYVGLSGVLHGLLAAGIVAQFPQRDAENTILAIIVLAKLAYEQFFGPLPGSEQTTGGTVIIAAHLYGAISGALCGIAMLIRVRQQASL